jgi:hypothetical protein
MKELPAEIGLQLGVLLPINRTKCNKGKQEEYSISLGGYHKDCVAKISCSFLRVQIITGRHRPV